MKWQIKNKQNILNALLKARGKLGTGDHVFVLMVSASHNGLRILMK